MPVIHIYKSRSLEQDHSIDLTDAIATFLGIDESDVAVFYVDSDIPDHSSYLAHIEISIPTNWRPEITRELLIIATRFACNALNIDESKTISTLSHIRMGEISNRGKIIE